MVTTARKIQPVASLPIEREIAELPKDDFKWCTVSLSDVLTAGKRLEAAVFDIEAKQALEIISECEHEKQPLRVYFTGI